MHFIAFASWYVFQWLGIYTFSLMLVITVTVLLLRLKNHLINSGFSQRFIGQSLGVFRFFL